MSPLVDELALRFTPKLRLILQTEATECGLACLGMIANFYGYSIDLATLRRRFPVSLKGANLLSLIRVATQIELSCRPLKLELVELSQLRLPCILHWNFNHFLVLQDVRPHFISVYDPAHGIRHHSMEVVGQSFTGVALELWPNPGFKPQQTRQRIKLRQLIGRVSGLTTSVAQILVLALSLEVFMLVSPFFQQWVIDNVIVSGDRDLLLTLALGFALLIFMQHIITALRGWILLYMSVTLNLQWRANAFTHLLSLPTTYFEKRHLGDVVSRFGAIDIIQKTLTTSFAEAILDGLVSCITLVLMFIYSTTLAWVSVGAMSLYALGRWVWFLPLRLATEEQIVHASKQQSHFLETIRGVKTIKLFQRQDERRSTWLSTLVDQLNADLRTKKLGLLYQSMNGLLFGVENILIIWLV